ncbi:MULTISPECIES: hypothetical protein [unclassified Streptomyces]
MTHATVRSAIRRRERAAAGCDTRELPVLTADPATAQAACHLADGY